MATRKKAGTSLTVWEEQMAAAAKKQAASEKDVASFQSISTRGGILSVDDTPLPDNELRCIVLMSVHENQYFAEDFDPSAIQIPVCYAFAGEDDDEDEMHPHEESSNPQNEACAGCELNEFGSADRGRGKACKNVRRLALITEDSVGDLENAEVRILKVPVTSVRNWSKYVKRLSEEMERPTWGVVTLIKLMQDAKTQFKIQFTFETLVEMDQDTFDGIQRMRGELAKTMTLPYQEPVEDAPPPRRAKAAPARKAAPAKASTANPGRSSKPAPAATKVKPSGRAARKF